MDGAAYVILLVARVRPHTCHPEIASGYDEQKVLSEYDRDGRVGGRLLQVENSGEKGGTMRLL